MIDIAALIGDDTIATLLLGVVLAYMMGVTSFALAKAGRSPLWVFCLLVPFVNIGFIWWFAFAKWPKLDEEA